MSKIGHFPCHSPRSSRTESNAHRGLTSPSKEYFRLKDCETTRWGSRRGPASLRFRSRFLRSSRMGWVLFLVVCITTNFIVRLMCTAEETADFVYGDFNFTHGLAFVGASATTACINITEYGYGFVHGNVDERQGSLDTTTREDGGEVVTTYVKTNNAAAVGEHEHIISSDISDHSRVCSEHMDPLFSTRVHATCSVRGGDGLAFVLHRDPRGIDAVGGPGANMGYGGLIDSLAVEFDHRYNPPGDGSNDIIYDHVGIHSSGRSNDNSPLASSELAPPVVWGLADGQHHLVKVKYFPRLATEYLDRFAATPNLLPYLKDNGEGRRLGTLVIWLDEGIANDEALVAVPINLSVLLNLPQDKAFVGFTGGTGRAWAKHDVLAWYWCHNDGGSREQKGNDGVGGSSWNGCGETPNFSTFRYGHSTEHHPESRLSRKDVELHRGGYGGGQPGDEATDFVAVPRGHWAGTPAGDWGHIPPVTEN